MTYCPDLNRTLLEQHAECRLYGNCEGLNISQVSININAVKAGCSTCPSMEEKLEQIEENFKWELILEDSTNNSYIDYLKNFLDLSLIHQQSFCLSGQKRLRVQETLALGGGFCYTINGDEEIFNEM